VGGAVFSNHLACVIEIGLSFRIHKKYDTNKLEIHDDSRIIVRTHKQEKHKREREIRSIEIEGRKVVRFWAGIFSSSDHLLLNL